MVSKNKKYLLVMMLILLTSAGALTAYYYYNKGRSGDNPTTSPDAGSQSSNSKPDPASSSKSNEATSSPSAPTLTKSSGNVGSVPRNITIEFVCEGEVGLSCEVTLKNKATAETVILPAKKIASSDRALSFASFDWQSKPGEWTVVATVTNDNGDSSSSEAQDLVVNE